MGGTNYTGPSIHSYAPGYDMTDESADNQANAFGLRLLPLDKNGQYWGYFQFYNSYFNNGGTSVASIWGIRRYIDGAIKEGTVSLGIGLTGSPWFTFPRCNARPTTTSSAATSNVDVIVKNYYSSTSGYVQFSSGLKIQWGRRTTNLPNNGTVQNFVKAFSTSNANVMVTEITSGVSRNNNPIVLKITTTGFTGYIEGPFCWFAIGY